VRRILALLCSLLICHAHGAQNAEGSPGRAFEDHSLFLQAYRFENLIQTRGMMADPVYRSIATSLEDGERCFRLVIPDYDQREGRTVLYLEAGQEVLISVERRKATKNCPESAHVLHMETDTKSVYLNEVFISEHEKEEVIKGTWEDGGQTLFALLSNPPPALRELGYVRHDSRNSGALYNILLVHMKARAIARLNVSEARESQSVVWLRSRDQLVGKRATDGEYDATSLTNWLRARLDSDEAMLLLSWREGRLVRQLITSEYVSERIAGAEKAAIMRHVRAMPDTLRIAGIIKTRAPRRRGLDINPAYSRREAKK